MKKAVACFWFFIVLGDAPTFAQHDTTYYIKYPDLLGLGFFESIRDNELQIQKLNPADGSVSDYIDYRTNGNSVSGLVINYDKLFAAIGLQRDIARPDRGPSKNTNIAVLLKGNQLVIETTWRSYTGFFDNNTFGYKPYLEDTVNYFTNESLNNRTFKVKGLYFLKPEKFSFNSAYYGSYRQLRSASSWLLNGNFYSGRLKAPGGIIPYYARDLFENYGDLHRIRVHAFSMGGGWSGNLVLFKRIFVNLLLSFGVEPQWRMYEFGGGYRTRPFHVSVASDLRLSGGYNSKRFFLIISSVNDRTFNDNSSISLRGNFLSVSFTAGYRFKFENKATRWLKENPVYKAL